MFANNKENWEDIDDFVAASKDPRRIDGLIRNNWQIRPTLYTAIIEFMQDGRKSAILLYHIYHAKQQYSIHDWERVELRIDDVSGVPGADAERIAYVVITRHSLHDRRTPGDPDLNFWTTGFGKHVMLWQAAWSYGLGPRRAELRWVRDSAQSIGRRAAVGSPARVRISGTSTPQDVNYVFLCDCDPKAMADWGGQRITPENAWHMAARTTGSAPWRDVPRAAYELQDLADILPSHWSGNPYYLHWQEPARTIDLESPILSEDGTSLVPAGRHRFYHGAYDLEDGAERRKGYTGKHWFWGTYRLGRSGSFTSKAFQTGTPGRRGGPSARRGPASGRADAHGRYWWQHDYFAHTGAIGDGTVAGEAGEWLGGAWYTAAWGGFDGRWVQLFADNPLRLAARVPQPVEPEGPGVVEPLDLAANTPDQAPTE